ncbi:hypothetical protein LshimejAT787_0505480 [Lyophyllum shimeji]|uniref:Uncharacterized protein n=1 Tax=Lyophyllum shimeji TaxID=47721 RepID=A0A9P3PML4_LYOSH|nr:hypothetical protein LshimejAT787_0505480 [Lyophyllum shimeji]
MRHQRGFQVDIMARVVHEEIDVMTSSVPCQHARREHSGAAVLYLEVLPDPPYHFWNPFFTDDTSSPSEKAYKEELYNTRRQLSFRLPSNLGETRTILLRGIETRTKWSKYSSMTISSSEVLPLPNHIATALMTSSLRKNHRKSEKIRLHKVLIFMTLPFPSFHPLSKEILPAA